jgi:hypothetical protein
MMECAGLYQPLFVITGSCQGIEISLDADAIPFGAVIQKSQSTRRIVMSNTGDIGARFCWDIAKFAPDFSINPVEGYVSPGMDVPFEIAFHPQEQNQDIRYEVRKLWPPFNTRLYPGSSTGLSAASFSPEHSRRYCPKIIAIAASRADRGVVYPHVLTRQRRAAIVCR